MGTAALTLTRADQRADPLAVVHAGLFGVQYEPIVEVSSGQVHAYEALARFHLPGGMSVPPAIVFERLRADPELLVRTELALKALQNRARAGPPRLPEREREHVGALGRTTVQEPHRRLARARGGRGGRVPEPGLRDPRSRRCCASSCAPGSRPRSTTSAPRACSSPPRSCTSPASSSSTARCCAASGAPRGGRCSRRSSRSRAAPASRWWPRASRAPATSTPCASSASTSLRATCSARATGGIQPVRC